MDEHHSGLRTSTTPRQSLQPRSAPSQLAVDSGSNRGRLLVDLQPIQEVLLALGVEELLGPAASVAPPCFDLFDQLGDGLSVAYGRDGVPGTACPVGK